MTNVVISRFKTMSIQHHGSSIFYSEEQDMSKYDQIQCTKITKSKNYEKNIPKINVKEKELKRKNNFQMFCSRWPVRHLPLSNFRAHILHRGITCSKVTDKFDCLVQVLPHRVLQTKALNFPIPPSHYHTISATLCVRLYLISLDLHVQRTKSPKGEMKLFSGSYNLH